MFHLHKRRGGGETDGGEARVTVEWRSSNQCGCLPSTLFAYPNNPYALFVSFSSSSTPPLGVHYLPRSGETSSCSYSFLLVALWCGDFLLFQK
ncbi:hypothetical protein ZIOFF_016951 [Zingiber officinale]|uniref:Uncharacterized protein n=1 Tax=Zingiber officinale TaxID=94328 RepID=A0A8J5H316_ZINOF|nr:hypothetical protein ZIOFF_016951 [Zingiber officinale]